MQMSVKAILGSWFEFLNHWAFFCGGVFCLSFTLDFFFMGVLPLVFSVSPFSPCIGFDLYPPPPSPPPLFSVVVSTNCQARPTFSLGNKSGADMMFLVLGVVPFFGGMACLIINIIVRFFRFFLLVVLFALQLPFLPLFPFL
jgi:hypothetical protein